MMTDHKTVSGAQAAVKEIRSACGILAMLTLDESITSRDLNVGLNYILEQLQPIEAGLTGGTVDLPVLRLSDVAAAARRPRPPLYCVPGDAA